MKNELIASVSVDVMTLETGHNSEPQGVQAAQLSGRKGQQQQ